MKNLMMKIIEENNTVGIIICKQDNEYVIKYCSDDRIIAREYELVWYNVYRRWILWILKLIKLKFLLLCL